MRPMKSPNFLVRMTVLVGAGLLTSLTPVQAEPPAERHRELVRLVRQDCGSCHGLTLSGGLGPSLLPEVMAAKPPEAMVATILYGRPGTAMPGWSQFMNEAEAEWVVEALMAGFPQDEAGRAK